MKIRYEHISLVTVGLLALWEVCVFNHIDAAVRGPLNPYVFFTNEARLEFLEASKKVLNGDFSTEDAMALLKKYDVRACVRDGESVRWRIPYFIMPRWAVDYIYSPCKPFPDYDSPDKADCQPLGGHWYWWRLR